MTGSQWEGVVLWTLSAILSAIAIGVFLLIFARYVENRPKQAEAIPEPSPLYWISDYGWTYGGSVFILHSYRDQTKCFLVLQQTGMQPWPCR